MNLKLVSVLSIVGLLAACGDSGSSSGGSGGTGTGGGDGGSTTNTGGNGPGPGPVGPGGGPGNGGSGGGEPACYDDSQAAGLVMLNAVAGQDVCTPAQVDAFVAACLDPAATEATCSAYTDDMANAACATCLGFGDMAPVNHPALLPAGMYVFVNTIACEATVQGKPECAQSAADLQFCVFNTCGECEQVTELPDCLGYSEQDICGQNFTVTDECATLFPAEGMEAAECSGADFESLFVAVANHLCGAP
jgi:hypothetical protein